MRKLLALSGLLILNFFQAQDFKLIPIGVRGGSDESNLSSYLIADTQEENYLSLDAGTLYAGIKFYLNRIQSTEEPSAFLQQKVKGYYISHPHFDHSSGLIINSPEDISGKKIYGLQVAIEAFKNHVFVWDTWANFANEGEKPILNKFIYQTLIPNTFIPIDGTALSMQTFPLSHVGEEKSSAVLVKNSKSAYFLYLGDTGADRIENSNALKNLWQSITPLVKKGHLKGIAIECSYTNAQANDKLFGHLKPELIIEEILKLEKLVGEKELKKVPFIITHIKYKKGIEEQILKELEPLTKKYKMIIAQQGEMIEL